MMNDNKATAVRIIKALGTGDVATVQALVTKDLIVTARGSSNVSGSRDREVVIANISDFPKITKSGKGIDFRILNLTAEDDRVACEVEGYATMLDGNDYNNHYHFLMFFRNGKLYKMHEYFDTKLADEVIGPYMKGKTI